MEGLLSSIFEPIKPLLDTLIDNLPLIFGVLLAVVLIGYAVIRLLITLADRWKRNGWKYAGSRARWNPRRPWELHPLSWLKLQPKHLHRLQAELMQSPGVREFYAPAAQYMEEKKDKGFYFPDGWLSPYPAAVRATMAENKVARKGKHMRARQQIREAARWATVKPLPSDVFIGGDQKQHFLVELALAKHRRVDVVRLMDDVAAVFNAESYEERKTESYDRVSMIVHLSPVEDILVERKFGVEFFDENPAKSPYSLPLAKRVDGKVWSLDMHHTLIYGMTGAGKGGPIQGAIRQLAPFVHQGRVKLYGIDPKGPELGAYAKKGVRMFERISIGLAEENIRQHVRTINEIASIVAQRGNSINPDFREGHEDLGRDFPATRETPWVVLFIDEYLTLVKGLKKLGKEGAAPLATLDQILATGRSFGIYVVLATQVATKEVFGDVRDNVPNAIVLKHKASDYWTTEFLGEDALELGNNPKAIGPSNKANGYRTAGIGYVSTAEGVVKVRFGYLSDKDIIAVARQFMEEGADESVLYEPTPEFNPKDYGLETTQEEADAAAGLFDDDDEGGFEISEASAQPEDDFSVALAEFKNGQGKRMH